MTPPDRPDYQAEGYTDLPDQGWPMIRLLEDQVPLDLFADVLAAIVDGLNAAGLIAYLRQETGFGTVWVVRRHKD